MSYSMQQGYSDASGAWIPPMNASGIAHHGGQYSCSCAQCTGGLPSPYFHAPESPASYHSGTPITPITSVDYFKDASVPALEPPSPVLPPSPQSQHYSMTMGGGHQSQYCSCPDCQNPAGYQNTSSYQNMSAYPSYPPQPQALNQQNSMFPSYYNGPTGFPNHQSPLSFATSNSTFQQPNMFPGANPMFPQQHFAPYFAPSTAFSAAQGNGMMMGQQQEPQDPMKAQREPVQVTEEAFQRVVGSMNETARSSGGSSFLQACLKDKTVNRFTDIYNELAPHFAGLLLDSHGCYVMRTLMEMMSAEQLQSFMDELSKNEDLVFSLCTQSLHTRRVVQYLLEASRDAACEFIIQVMVKCCKEIATTQQGCIAMQRVLDCANATQRKSLYDCIYEHFLEFSQDPFANYVIQYILEKGTDKETTSNVVLQQFQNNVASLACNKFASNVVEKVLHHTTLDVQHAIVTELYGNTPEFLQSMLQDSFGNYIVQATIALCSTKDVWMISEKLSPVLHTTPYGYKIAARLERRLKGKPLTNARTVSYTQNQTLRS